ncbi:MAG: hypothetical protein ACLVES_01850 [Faecalibacterium prausnitzii]
MAYTMLDATGAVNVQLAEKLSAIPPSSGASCDAAIKFPEAAALPGRRSFRKRMRLNPVIDHSRDLR